MKPTIEELFNDDQYIKLAELPYTEMIPFVQNEFAKRNTVIRIYIWLNIFILLLMIMLGILQSLNGQISVGMLISNTLIGFALTLTILIPVHEALHGLAYKLLGAPKVAFGGNIRQFYFYAVADRFVIGKNGFKIIALTPFVVISMIAIIGILLTPVKIQWICWGVLLMHTGACAGDFGLLGFYKRHPGGDIFTFDHVKEKVAYFFQKKI
ncbi:MAG: DUF3267 domain-containing protein [Saprospiraceae bacterium]|nr:DUF3267 domain-containing protein [Saprospiraceae bacterium]